MRLILLLLSVGALAGVEGEATVLQALSGNSIQVLARFGAAEVPLVIRMGYVRAPEGPSESFGKPWVHAGAVAQAVLSTRLTPGTKLRLVAPGERLRFDDDGRLLALLYRVGAVVSVQEALIDAGVAAYDRTMHVAPGDAHARLLAAETQARTNAVGGWKSLPTWMANGVLPPSDPAALNRARALTRKDDIRRDGIAGLRSDQLDWSGTWVCPECDEVGVVGDMLCEDCGYILSDAEMRKMWARKP